jgi:C-terminal processing protease CtpA/Prc
VALNVTLGSTTQFAGQVLRLLQRPGVRQTIVDLRNNPGGNNTTYDPLLSVLRDAPGLTVLTSRTTFSAAANLIAELEREAEPLLVGEPTGGSPNIYGDPVDIQLPETGLTAHVAGVWWELAGADDGRLEFYPDVSVGLVSADLFAGRDPVLTAALGRAPR